MELEKKEIEQRLAGHFNGSQRLVFWEDAAGDYAHLIPNLHVDGVVVLDITGAELASKRRVLRQEPSVRFVLYRSGETPDCSEDMVYDLKLAASPFTCSMEGIWADECGIAPDKAYVLADHTAFFKSKERREALGSSNLSKETDAEIRLALAAAILRVKEGNYRDAVRSMSRRALIEWSRGDASSMNLLAEAGLADVFWRAVKDVVGYKVSDGAVARVEDMAFRMLEATCSTLIDDSQMADPAECTRILESLAASSATRGVYECIVTECGPAVQALIPEDSKDIDSLVDCDALREFDEWILMSFARSAATGSLDLAKLENVWTRRRHSIWADQYKQRYEALLALGKFKRELTAYKKAIPAATTLKKLFDCYCDDWHRVDTCYREFYALYRPMQAGRFKETLSEAASAMSHDYDRFLVDLTDRWQLHLMDDGQWPPSSIPTQDRFFHDYVEARFPRADKSKRIGVIVSDALRYETGFELAVRIGSSKRQGLAGRVKAKCEGMACLLPSYTQLGMAALLPNGPMNIDPATMAVKKSDVSTLGTANRQKLLQERIAGAVAFKAADVLGTTKLVLDTAPVAVVYHNVIDKTGDARETETKVFSAVKEAFSEIEELTAILMRSGCSTVLITADHGFIYQDQDPEGYLYADVANLNLLKSNGDIVCDHTRRFVVGQTLPESDMLIEYAAIQLGLDGEYSIAFPKGITRLRLSGSGARFVHGGASLQENAIPVVVVSRTVAANAAHPSEVEGFPIGRTVITGSTTAVNVYQVEPCGADVAPVNVKVGVYGADGKLLCASEKQLKLSSQDQSTDARKTKVVLELTDDVDDYAKAVVRISAQVGATSAYATAWETEYSVVRAFGSDF